MEEPVEYKIGNEPEPDPETYTKIATQIFCAFINAYAPKEEPYNGNLYNLVVQACEYTEVLLSEIYLRKINRQKEIGDKNHDLDYKT